MFKLYNTYDNNKKFMIDMIFGEFNIISEYIIYENEKNNILTLKLRDEINQEATLTINFNTNDYTINLDGYIETKEFILID